MQALVIDLTIRFDSAVSVGAGGSAGTIADKSIVRDGHGRPLIPGSHLKGKVRHATERVAAALGLAVPDNFNAEDDTMIRQLFGSPQLRSRLVFRDLVATLDSGIPFQPKLAPDYIRPSVAISRRLGTAADELLVFQEAAQETLQFHNPRAISGMVPDLDYAALLWAGLRLNRRWGGATSRGLGWASAEMTLSINQQVVSTERLEAALRTMAGRKR